MKKSSITVFVCNMSEDVWQFISSLDDSQAKQYEIAENANMSDWNIFGFHPHEKGILLSPRPLSSAFLAHAREFSGATDVTVLTPRRHTGQTSLDGMKDKKIFSELLRLGKTHALAVTSYTASAQFYALVQKLQRHGVEVTTPDAPRPENAWTLELFGSKTGFRQLYLHSTHRHPEFVMCPGWMFVDIRSAAKFAAHIYKKGGVVFKTHKGHSGFGVLIIHPGSLTGQSDTYEEQIFQKLSNDNYWKKFPIVVEQHTPDDPHIAGGFPNVEGYIDNEGSVHILYICGLRMTREGVFKGIEIHENSMSSKDSKLVSDVTTFVGEEYSQYGYRGFFEIDFVAGVDGKIYALESSTRRTGGTHVHTISQKIFGKGYTSQIYSLSNNNRAFPKGKTFTFTSLKTLLTPFLFNWKTKEGIVLTSENMLRQHAFAYIIFSKTNERAVAIETQMEALLRA